MSDDWGQFDSGFSDFGSANSDANARTPATSSGWVPMNADDIVSFGLPTGASAQMGTSFTPEECPWCEGAGCDACTQVQSTETKGTETETKTQEEGSNLITTLFVLDPKPLALTPEDVLAAKESAIHAVAETLYTTKEDADCLLRAYDWNHMRLLDEWIETLPESVRNKSGQYDPKIIPDLTQPRTLPEDGAAAGGLEETKSTPWSVFIKVRPFVLTQTTAKVEDGYVPCCFMYCDPVPVAESVILPCGHSICKEHMESLVEAKVREGSECVRLRCPGIVCTDSKCNHSGEKGCMCKQLVPHATILKMLPDTPEGIKLKTKFSDWVCSEFVQWSHFHRRCRNPRCNIVIQVSPSVRKAEFICLCGTISCALCGNGPHDPCPCDLATKFTNFMNVDTATLDYIASISKRCPKCSNAIIKDRNCNHITCKCGHEFCWLCKRPWADHFTKGDGSSHYECKLYNRMAKEGDYSEEELRMMAAGRENQRTKWFTIKFENFEENSKSFSKLFEQFEANYPHIADDVGIRSAFVHVLKALNFLKWSYAFSYFLDGGSKDLFTAHQNNLQTLCEGLKARLEMAMRDSSALFLDPDFRSKVVNESGELRFFCDKLHESADELADNLSNRAGKFDDNDNWACGCCFYVHNAQNPLEGLLPRATSLEVAPMQKPHKKDERFHYRTQYAPRTTELRDKTGQKLKIQFCVQCGACRLHSEIDCRVCNPC